MAPLRGVPARYRRLAGEPGKRIIGQDEIIRDLFVALAVQGRILMIGVPGLAKTPLVRRLAEILALEFQRIQFVLRHRLIAHYRAEADHMTGDGIIEQLLESIR